MTRLKIVFLGTPDIACPFLEKLATDSRFEVQAVITQEDKKVGRKQLLTPPPIKNTATRLGLPVYQTPKLNKDTPLIEMLQKLAPDFLIVVAFGQILSSKILELPRIKPINVHGSTLPAYRGATPIEQALLNGDTATGLSVMEMDKTMDTGPIYEYYDLPIAPEDNDSTLRIKLAALGAPKLPDTLCKIADGSLKSTPQIEEKATYCAKIVKENGEIHPESETAEQIINKFRAYYVWPGIFMKVKDKIVKILEISLHEGSLPGGKFEINGGKILLGTTSGVLEITKLQLEGKNPQSAREFINGNRQILM